MICWNKSWISATEYDLSGNSNFLFYRGADILKYEQYSE